MKNLIQTVLFQSLSSQTYGLWSGVYYEGPKRPSHGARVSRREERRYDIEKIPGLDP